ncbi:MAG: SDR family oxidoreductase [Eubacteriales bacterium]
MIDVKGRWALITGASRGIGKELALFMAENGCNLIIQSRKRSSTDEIAEEIIKRGVEVFQIEAELSDMDSVNKMLAEIDGLKADVDIVFNNAGIQPGYRPEYFSTPESDYEISFLVNTIAPMKICYHFIPKMLERGFGRVINTTSGIQNEPEQAGYSASKAALDKVTIDLQTKLKGKNVILSLVDPGWCRTDMGGSQAPNDPKSALPGVALGAFIDNTAEAKIISAQEYSGMTLVEALRKIKEK